MPLASSKVYLPGLCRKPCWDSPWLWSIFWVCLWPELQSARPVHSHGPPQPTCVLTSQPGLGPLPSLWPCPAILVTSIWPQWPISGLAGCWRSVLAGEGPTPLPPPDPLPTQDSTYPGSSLAITWNWLNPENTTRDRGLKEGKEKLYLLFGNDFKVQKSPLYVFCGCAWEEMTFKDK